MTEAGLLHQATTLMKHFTSHAWDTLTEDRTTEQPPSWLFYYFVEFMRRTRLSTFVVVVVVVAAVVVVVVMVIVVAVGSPNSRQRFLSPIFSLFEPQFNHYTWSYDGTRIRFRHLEPKKRKKMLRRKSEQWFQNLLWGVNSFMQGNKSATLFNQN